MKEHEILNEINKVKKIMTMTRVVGVLMIIAIFFVPLYLLNNSNIYIQIIDIKHKNALLDIVNNTIYIYIKINGK